MTIPVTPQHPISMSEEAFFERIKHGLVVLSTSSGDKIADYTALFSALASGENDTDKGINTHFTHIGAFGIANNYVAEIEGNAFIHAGKKLARAMQTLEDNHAHIRNKLRQGSLPNPDEIELVSMVEDSEWSIDFSGYDANTKHSFLQHIKAALQERLREEDQEILFQNLDVNNPNAAFPGAHLKPIQEHLQGGLVEMMELIYDAAEEAEMKNLRYISSIEAAFGFQHTGEIFHYRSESKGSVIDRNTFHDSLRHLPSGIAVTSDTIHIPDMQLGQPKTFDRIASNLLIESSRDIPADHPRRNFAEWLQTRIGARAFSEAEQQHKTHIAYLSASSLEHGKILEQQQEDLLWLLKSNDFSFTTIPTYEELHRLPSSKMLDAADIILLEAEPLTTLDNGVTIDPNLSVLAYLGVTIQVDPESVNRPLILDNCHGQWNHTLKLFREATAHGRMLGDFPFIVANSENELTALLNEYAAISKQATIVPQSEDRKDIPQEEIIPIPQDGITSVFVAGGHANNNKRDKEQAIELGYYLASEGYRIVTGGGQIDGSMGGVHTGFVQYHLDQLQQHVPTILSENHKQALRDHQFNAETLILDRPDVIDALAEAGYIPANMFFSYSTEDLMRMENPNGELNTAGGTHQNVANRLLRLDEMLKADISVVLSGGIGTYEEIDGWIRRERERSSGEIAANDNHPTTPKTLIIHNQDNFYDALLMHYGLMDKTGHYNKVALDNMHIKIAHSPQEMEVALDTQPQSYVTHASAEKMYKHNLLDNLSVFH
jgi:predicted Rossmann-fold nucleotide-binding protein